MPTIADALRAQGGSFHSFKTRQGKLIVVLKTKGETHNK